MPFTVHPSVCDIRKDISDPKLIIVVIGDNERTVQARSGATEARKVTGLLNKMLDIENFSGDNITNDLTSTTRDEAGFETNSKPPFR